MRHKLKEMELNYSFLLNHLSENNKPSQRNLSQSSVYISQPHGVAIELISLKK